MSTPLRKKEGMCAGDLKNHLASAPDETIIDLHVSNIIPQSRLPVIGFAPVARIRNRHEQYEDHFVLYGVPPRPNFWKDLNIPSPEEWSRLNWVSQEKQEYPHIIVESKEVSNVDYELSIIESQIDELYKMKRELMARRSTEKR